MPSSKQTNKALVSALIHKHPIISDQVEHAELRVILQELAGALDNGQASIVEVGCFVGTTSLFIQRILQATGVSPDKFHVYDSFSGLPEKRSQDESPAGTQFKAGELKASKSALVQNFRRAGVPLPRIHKGWFHELTAEDVPPAICFAFLDGDYYDSIKQSFALIQNALLPGAVVIVDDYQSEALPGAKKATDEWLAAHSKNCQVVSSLAVIRI